MLRVTCFVLLCFALLALRAVLALLALHAVLALLALLAVLKQSVH